MPQEENALLWSRGLHYGDGVYRTMAVRRGKILYFLPQLKKLSQDARRLQITPLPVPDVARACEKAISPKEDAVLKIIVTRGGSRRGYRPEAGARPSFFVLKSPWPERKLSPEGIKARLCRLRLCRQPALAGIKHLNRLENVLACAEWDDPQTPEGVLLDSEGFLVGGTMSNLFLWNHGMLWTPSLRFSGVRGLTRSLIALWARKNRVPLRVGSFKLSDFFSAKGAFFCNSVSGIWPIASCEDKTFQDFEVAHALLRAIFP